MSEKNYYRKIKGCIFGGFIGDSIGFLFEGKEQSYINLYLSMIENKNIVKYIRGYSNKLNINGPIEKKYKKMCEWYYNFGQYSDDSQLTFLVIENILKNNGIFNINEYGKQITDMFKNKKIIGNGSTTKEFTKNYSNKINYKFTGVNSTSNGSLMRSDIFGLLFFNSEDNKLFDCVQQQCLMTHYSNLCFSTSLCSAYIIKYIMKNHKIEDDLFLYELYNLVKNINLELSLSLLKMKSILILEWKEAFDEIKKLETIFWDKNKLSSCTLTTLLWAIYSFLKNKDSYENCLLMALKVGGDVDTIAKIACSYSGCYLGIDKLPKIFLEKLHDKNDNNYKNINDKINILSKLIKDNKINYL